MSAWLENWDVCGPPLSDGSATPLVLSFDDREWMHRTLALAVVERLDVMLCRETAISERRLMARARDGVPLSFTVPPMLFQFDEIEPHHLPPSSRRTRTAVVKHTEQSKDYTK